MDFLTLANQINEELIQNRRAFHAFAETGFDLPNTLALVQQKLTQLGVPYKKVGKAGIVATIGQGAPCVLLRGDMDALPMDEQSGLPFASDHLGCHSCGHDFHTAMLLGASKLLKQHESELSGCVKLMFQPAEELLAGAADMVEHGVLQNPTVDAAFGIHIMAGSEHSDVGTATYSVGPALYSGDALKIEVIGKTSHGGSAFMGVDAINIAAHIVIALNEIISREIPSDESSVVLVGKIEGGLTVNTTPGNAAMEVSVRAQTAKRRAFLLKRVEEIATATAAVFRGEAVVRHMYGIGPLHCDEAVAKIGGDACQKIGIDAKTVPTAYGTEDFTAVAEKVPSVMLNLGAGSVKSGHPYPMHNPQMVADEAVLPLGAALYAQCAVDFLTQKK